MQGHVVSQNEHHFPKDKVPLKNKKKLNHAEATTLCAIFVCRLCIYELCYFIWRCIKLHCSMNWWDERHNFTQCKWFLGFSWHFNCCCNIRHSHRTWPHEIKMYSEACTHKETFKSIKIYCTMKFLLPCFCLWFSCQFLTTLLVTNCHMKRIKEL